MKRSSRIAGMALLSVFIHANADAKGKPKMESYEYGTILRVYQNIEKSNYIGSPTDAPLRATEYDYNITVRLNCKIYVGRYVSPINYVPSSLAPNHAVEVRLHNHILHLRMPELGREVAVSIVGHKRLKDDACWSTGSSGWPGYEGCWI